MADEPLRADPQIDWRARADGRNHVLKHGEHYTREAALVRRAAAMWALRNGMRAVTKASEDSITVRFVPNGGKV